MAPDDPRSLIRDGNRLFEQKKFSEAAELYDRAAALVPESAVPLYNRAAALQELGAFDEAAKLYKQARVRAPDELRRRINYALGDCELELARRAVGADGQPQPAAKQPAQAAIDFYREALADGVPAKSPRDAESVSAARRNIELAKRLIQQIPTPPPQPSEASPENRDDPKKPSPDSGDSGDANQSQSNTADSKDAESKQGRPASVSDEKLSPDEAADRLRAAISRAQAARARRLDDKAKQPRGSAVDKDW